MVLSFSSQVDTVFVNARKFCICRSLFSLILLEETYHLHNPTSIDDYTDFLPLEMPQHAAEWAVFDDFIL